jgi:hypothetical protein
VVFGPESFLNFFPRNDFTWVFKEKGEDLERLLLKLQLHALLSQFSCVGAKL